MEAVIQARIVAKDPNEQIARARRHTHAGTKPDRSRKGEGIGQDAQHRSSVGRRHRQCA